MKNLIYLYCICALFINFKNLLKKTSTKKKKIKYILNISVFSIALILNHYPNYLYTKLYIIFLILGILILIITIIDNLKNED